MMKAVAAAVLGNSFFGLSFLFSKVALERLEPVSYTHLMGVSNARSQ